ncbi:Protein of unknown function (DUF3591) [Seminavis robusta]|uniref:Uncharacterized protein n=1 Tax=Seminavis robusta TaxID=568900 RepID=A0A9N8DWE9_9STRA|nr:Protein of unknown function (DUF3591) [Seminavis robusta]|eukprot:Sro331_g119150.1 Protein of unknown function (DUF3591) (134) ;mRNA; r:42644-43045
MRFDEIQDRIVPNLEHRANAPRQSLKQVTIPDKHTQIWTTKSIGYQNYDDNEEDAQERVEEDENQGRPRPDRVAVNRSRSTGSSSREAVNCQCVSRPVEAIPQAGAAHGGLDSSRGFAIKLGEKERQSGGSLR